MKLCKVFHSIFDKYIEQKYHFIMSYNFERCGKKKNFT